MHRDDIEVLKHIQTNLNLGKVYLKKNDKCIFIIKKTEELYKLISIFDKYTLNTTKYLDYLDFKNAFILYSERKGIVTPELKDQLLSLKNRMNRSRTNFNMPTNHEIKITKY